MFAVLRNRTYAQLFAAQIIALLGTGLLTIALGLLAFEIARNQAGAVLGTAMAVKMIAYVVVGPLIAAMTIRVQRKHLLVISDLIRAAVALGLPFVSHPWQIYVLIFLLQSASATFTPAFQSVIPSILPDEDDYTCALSLSRLAYDLESLLSPLLAAALLSVISYHHLFMGTVLGFLGSATLVVLSHFPQRETPPQSPFVDRLTEGVRVFWRTQDLRALIALNLVVAAATAMVIINTVVLVKGRMGLEQTSVAILLGAYGAGSMICALLMPRLLTQFSDRQVMLTGGAVSPVTLLAAGGAIKLSSGPELWLLLLLLWFFLGAAASMILTPSSRLLRRSSTEQNRPAVFAAQFSLSHACYLVTYPLAGIAGAVLGLPMTALIHAMLGALGIGFALWFWRVPS